MVTVPRVQMGPSYGSTPTLRRTGLFPCLKYMERAKAILKLILNDDEVGGAPATAERGDQELGTEQWNA